MEEARKELDRIQKALWEDETQVITEDLDQIVSEVLEQSDDAAQQDENAEISLNDILDDAELSDLLAVEEELPDPGEKPQPAFDDPDVIHDPEEGMVYNNYANDYGNADEEEEEQEKRRRNDIIAIVLMSIACVLCLGIIGILIYWLAVLL